MKRKMSKAEERALEAYPVREDFYRHDGVARSQTFDLNADKRYYYQQGYEQAEKDTIERAVKWIQEHANEYIVDIAVETYPDAPQKLVVGGMCWVHLKQALEEEQ